MALIIDTTGLSDFSNLLGEIIEQQPEFNKEFLQEEFEIFKPIVQDYSPVDTGHLRESYFSTPIRQDGNVTEQEWYNNAGEHDYNAYASYVNYGTTRQKPQYFWERGMNHAEERRSERYSEKFAKKFTEL